MQLVLQELRDITGAAGRELECLNLELLPCGTKSHQLVIRVLLSALSAHPTPLQQTVPTLLLGSATYRDPHLLDIVLRPGGMVHNVLILPLFVLGSSGHYVLGLHTADVRQIILNKLAKFLKVVSRFDCLSIKQTSDGIVLTEGCPEDCLFRVVSGCIAPIFIFQTESCWYDLCGGGGSLHIMSWYKILVRMLEYNSCICSNGGDCYSHDYEIFHFHVSIVVC